MTSLWTPLPLDKTELTMADLFVKINQGSKKVVSTQQQYLMAYSMIKQQTHLFKELCIENPIRY